VGAPYRSRSRNSRALFIKLGETTIAANENRIQHHGSVSAVERTYDFIVINAGVGPLSMRLPFDADRCDADQYSFLDFTCSAP
jgi:hypothetical protein